MPNDISQPREGENRRSHQARRDASSSNGGRVRDFATLPFQRHEEQQTNGKGLAPAERKNRRAIDENGKLVEKQIMLSNRYDQDHPGLPGGMNYWNLPERSPGQPELTEEEKRLHETWRPFNEEPSGRDLNQGLAIHMEQQRAAQRQEPDASSSRQGDIPAERKGKIEALISDLIAFPGSAHRSNSIRVDMRANKINASEYRYIQRSLYGREDIGSSRKGSLMETIRKSYCE